MSFRNVVLWIIVFQQDFVSQEQGCSDCVFVGVVSYHAIVMVAGIVAMLKPIF